MKARTRVPASFFSSLPLSILFASTLFFATFSAAFFLARISQAQQAEFPKSKGGLIYSEHTMGKLKTIVDSLNLKFRNCEPYKNYRGRSQARGHYVRVFNNRAAMVLGDMERGIPFDAFEFRYRDVCQIEKDQLIVKFSYTDYNEQPTVMFSNVSFSENRGHELAFTENLKAYDQLRKGKWIIKLTPESKYQGEQLEAFYLEEDMLAPPLPAAYARQVQYADCMIDTTTQLYTAKARASRWGGYPEAKKVEAFLKFVQKETNHPVYNSEKHKLYLQQLAAWEKTKYPKLDKLKAESPEFSRQLAEAVTEALEKGGNYGEFEEYVYRYHSKKAALNLKRGYMVVGSCSMDSSPRDHARSIASLAAEAASWEVFLRSHLDLMNDNFIRNSDGNYAWGARQTYYRELEALNLNVPDLLFGITLQLGNASKNHYYGTANRVGRAFHEARNPRAIETRILHMVSDPHLDLYNRIMAYYLFLNYTGYLENENRQKENIARLNTAVKSWPAFVASKALVQVKE